MQIAISPSNIWLRFRLCMSCFYSFRNGQTVYELVTDIPWRVKWLRRIERPRLYAIARYIRHYLLFHCGHLYGRIYLLVIKWDPLTRSSFEGRYWLKSYSNPNICKVTTFISYRSTSSKKVYHCREIFLKNIIYSL